MSQPPAAGTALLEMHWGVLAAIRTSPARQIHPCLGMRVLEKQHQHLGFPFPKSVFLWGSLGRRLLQAWSAGS